MGKQLTGVLKSKAKSIYGNNKDEFNTDYEENKKKLAESKYFDYSKTDRNIIAGFITRLKKAELRED